ncbi:MAG: hypothetical protein QN155_10690 [Armatimonadota bacterium]|nr:hypothetical protein [Armatimonadota bacterium]MDR7404453.1 hypothetical protein [Armatimonadota bacterium]
MRTAARRADVGGRVVAVVAGVLAGLTVRATAEGPQAGCTPGRLTPPAAEGPYYREGSPRRTSLLEPGMPGVRLRLGGGVFTRTCRPVPGAWLDFWQADARGAYDLAGYRLRGHQFADGRGRYALETVIPGGYGGRTPHIHVKVRAPAGPTLTTQLYFPGHPRNQQDPLFRPDLVVALREEPGGVAGSFDFVLDVD